MMDLSVPNFVSLLLGTGTVIAGVTVVFRITMGCRSGEPFRGRASIE